MKTFSFLLIGLLLFSTVKGVDNKGQTVSQAPATTTSTINIGCSPVLIELTSKWSAGYMQIDQTVAINVIENNNDQSIDLNLVSGELISDTDKSGWKIAVGREIVVPVMNSRNPMAETFSFEGVSAAEWKEIVTADNGHNWRTLLGMGSEAPIHFYVIDDASTNSVIAKFLKIDAGLIKGTLVANASELLAAIQTDVNAIGFCNLPDAIIAGQSTLAENISLMPIDKNGNGRLDRFENIYSSVETFTRGAWVGKYPKSLCSNIYAVAAQKPSDKSQLAFLAWIMGDGQKLLNSNGFTVLASNEIKDNITSLTGVEIVSLLPEEKKSNTALIIIIAGVLVAGALATIVIRSIKGDKINDKIREVQITDALNENSIEAPAGLYYDKSHTWAYMEKDGKVKIGIDGFIPHLTGKISKVTMKEPGETIRKGEKILTLSKDGKKICIHAPVSGTITDQNSALINNPGIINSSPYNYGWVYTIEPKNWLREIEFMFMRDKYKVWLHDEFARLKDFLSSSVKTNESAYTHIVLQDGGEITNNVLAELEPEVWEDFQTKFIDTSK